ncbi:hypothetical protein HNP46_004180 [Pseudomonas nitritireducens]|uniref:Uncharacterized protein n=1 Tax=Pseudomonas nitroreducens TaxID=46680 RepID=A0A7W7KMZ4_PSENT|nr:hypothetical protein [Pseudomonas nitritireducens]MBB4865299.1 hypothetical protein [Pseudomonas nitritireducens]
MQATTEITIRKALHDLGVSFDTSDNLNLACKALLMQGVLVVREATGNLFKLSYIDESCTLEVAEGEGIKPGLSAKIASQTIVDAYARQNERHAGVQHPYGWAYDSRPGTNAVEWSPGLSQFRKAAFSPAAGARNQRPVYCSKQIDRAIVALRDLWDQDECPAYSEVETLLRRLLPAQPT